jgi:DNA-binding response OmpR family regulator
MKKTVLVVDDDLLFLELMELTFENMGFTMLEATRVEDAIAQVLTTQVDLITVDLDIPGYSGIDLLDVMREHFSHIPCIVVSGCPADVMKKSCKQLGALGYIEKPCSIASLTEGIQSILAE